VDLDPDRLFREIDFMSPTGFATNDRMRHFIAFERG
jgi:hypothetical protein